MGWLVILVPGVLPYLQLFGMAFISVTSLGLSRRSWMLKWVVGAGRWSLIHTFLTLVLVGTVNFSSAGQHAEGHPHWIVTMSTSWGVLTLGASLFITQGICCIFEVAHMITEEGAIGHAALLMYATAKVDAKCGGGN